MQKYLKIIGAVIGLCIAIILIGALFTSKKYHYEKSIEINTNPAKVWRNVNSIKKANKWMPFSIITPETLTAYTGTDGEIGSTFSWSGKLNTGSGKITLLNSNFKQENQNDSDFEEEYQILYEIELENPKQLNSIMTINVESFNKNSLVTWEIDNKIPYPFNFFVVNFMNKDYLFEKEFNEGLTNLKALSEQ